MRPLIPALLIAALVAACSGTPREYRQYVPVVSNDDGTHSLETYHLDPRKNMARATRTAAGFCYKFGQHWQSTDMDNRSGMIRLTFKCGGDLPTR